MTRKRSKRRELEALRAELRKRESIEQLRKQPPSEDKGIEESSGDDGSEKGHQIKGGKRRRRNGSHMAKAKKQISAEAEPIKLPELKGKATPSVSEPPSKVVKSGRLSSSTRTYKSDVQGEESKQAKGKGCCTILIEPVTTGGQIGTPSTSDIECGT